ncbi:MAG: TetR family transcriptional regulator [Lachnospiraceae bacterium]|nr:TetR family transcriptional regulator [Lachnospiraceae bacterium]
MRRETEKASIEEKISDSFRELVKKKDPDKITVREIADGAGVIRATFYNHFKDKADLLQYMIRTEIIEPVHGLMRSRMHREAVVLIFQSMKRDGDFYLRAAEMTKPVPFEEIAYICIYDLIYDHMKEAGVKKLDHPWLTVRMISNMYAHIISFIAIEWIRTGMQISPEEVGLVFEYIGTKPLWDILAAIERDPSVVNVLTENPRPRF